jgi:hypothetical protein
MVEIDPQRQWSLHVEGETGIPGPLVAPNQVVGRRPHLSSSRIDLWLFVFDGGLMVLGVGFIMDNRVLLT